MGKKESKWDASRINRILRKVGFPSESCRLFCLIDGCLSFSCEQAPFSLAL